MVAIAQDEVSIFAYPHGLFRRHTSDSLSRSSDLSDQHARRITSMRTITREARLNPGVVYSPQL